MNKSFGSEKFFRISLQKRLINIANEKGGDIQELMKKVAFDRFLCRLFSAEESPWLLKGGYALELHFDTSRTTKDIDLVLKNHNIVRRNDTPIWEIDFIKESLNAYLNKELNDFFTFVLTGEEKSLDNTPYGGKRYSIESRIAGKRYVSFHIDISVNDVSKRPYFETIDGKDWIGFAGIPPVKCNILAAEEIFAEKFHAYTLPRDKENTRVRDIMDMYLLIDSKRIEPNRLIECMNNVFRRRKTHEIPENFPQPPISWEKRCNEIAKNCGINKNIEEVFNFIKEYLESNVLDYYKSSLKI